VKRLKLWLLDALVQAAQFFASRDSRLALLLVRLLGIPNRELRQARRVPLAWLDEDTSALRATLEPAAPGHSYGPAIGGAQRIEDIQLPAVNLYCYDKAQICATSSSILLEDRMIVERVAGVDARRCDFSCGQLLMHGQTSALVKMLPREDLEKGVFLGGNGAFNYYHWMVEIAPKLQFLQDLGEEHADFPLLLSEYARDIASFREALGLLSQGRRLIFLDKSKAYRVGRLAHINAPNACPFNLRPGRKLEVADFLFRESSIAGLRRRLGADAAGGSPVGRGRLFIGRRSSNRRYNQEEVFELFSRHGFTMVFPEDLSLRRQADLFSDAELVAGPTGAAWTNLLFCRQGVRCLCWMAAEYSEFSAFSNLARIVGADLRYLTYGTGLSSTAEIFSSGYRIDAKEVKNGLDALLAGS
jgi:capsular polysaccharide biosynthesis protein